MMALAILYPEKEGVHFEMTYYVETHMPVSNYAEFSTAIFRRFRVAL